MASVPFPRTHRSHSQAGRLSRHSRRNWRAAAQGERNCPWPVIRRSRQCLRFLAWNDLLALIDFAPYVVANNSGIGHLAASAARGRCASLPQAMRRPSGCREALGWSRSAEACRARLARSAGIFVPTALPVCQVSKLKRSSGFFNRIREERQLRLARRTKNDGGVMRLYYFVHITGTDIGISGIPRVVKGLGRELKTRADVELVPVRWCHKRRAIVHAERQFLSNLARFCGPELHESEAAGDPIKAAEDEWASLRRGSASAQL